MADARTHDLRELRASAKAAAVKDEFATLGEFMSGPYLDYCKEHHRGDAEAAVRYLKASFKTLLDKRIDEITAWDISESFCSLDALKD
jgi:hypothetical protein